MVGTCGFKARSAKKRVGPQLYPLSGAKSFSALDWPAREGTCTVKTMSTQPRREVEAAAAELAMTGVALRQAEKEWKDLRALSRRITLELVTEHGLSVAKASQMSGHTRQTIKIWLDVWNAEHKHQQKKN